MRLIKFIILLALVGCLSTKSSKREVYLLVSNESRELTSIDLKIDIDGKNIVNKDFVYTNNTSDYEIFCIDLEKGKHILEVSSLKENLSVSKKISLSKENMIFIGFSYVIIRDTVAQRLKFYMKHEVSVPFVYDSIWSPKTISIKHFKREVTIY